MPVNHPAAPVNARLPLKRQLLKHSSGFLSKFYAASPLPWQSLDDNRILRDVNQAWLNLMGYHRSEVIGQPLAAFIHPDCLDQVSTAWKNFKTSGSAWGIEYHLRRRDGTYVPISVDGKILCDSHGRFLATHCLLTDISSRKIKEKLQKREADYRILAENMEDVVWQLDLQTMKLLYVSPSVERLRGYTPEEVLRQTLPELVTPDSFNYLRGIIPQLLEMFKRNAAPDARFVEIIHQPHKNGSTVVTEVSSRVFKRSDGSFEVIGVSRECGGRLQQQEELSAAHRQLQTARNFLRSLIDSAPCVLYCLDTHGNILYMNKRFADKLKITIADAEQHHLQEILPAELYERHAALLAECLKGHTASFIDEQPFPQSPDCKYFYGAYNPVCNEQNQVELIIGAAMNITEQKQMEDQLDIAQRIAKMGSWEWDLTSRSFSCSKALAGLFSFSGDGSGDYPYQQFLQQILPEDNHLLSTSLWRLLRHKQPTSAEFRIMHPAGGIRTLRSQTDLAFSGNGCPSKIIGTIVDITQSKQFARIEKEAATRLREFAQTVPDISFIVDENGCIVEIFGNESLLFASDEIPTGQSLTGFMSKPTAEQFLRDIHYALQHATLQFGEYLVFTTIGTRMFEMRIAPMTYTYGSKRTVACNARDSTDKNRTKKLLQASYERRRKRDLLNELMQGKLSPTQSVLDQAWRVNLNLAQPLSCYVLIVEEWQNKSAAYWHDHRDKLQFLLDSMLEVLESEYPSIIWEIPDGIGILAAPENSSLTDRNLAEQLLSLLEANFPSAVLSIGISEFYGEAFPHLAAMYNQARDAASFGRKLNPHGQIHHYLDLGVFQIFPTIAGGNASAFISRTLGKLLEYDAKKDSQLVFTLEKILQNDNLKLVAEQMFVHHKTVVFRKKRIEEILGVSLDDFETKLTLSTALKLRQVL